MYSIHGHGMMIADKVRTGSYARALRRVIERGAVVLDIGAGTGVLSFIACDAGARRVYAIEPDNIIHLAKELARVNGYADRVEFIQGLSTKTALPEPVDVVVSDIRGVLPMFGQSLTSIADARERLLAPGGTLIPQADQLWGTLVEAPKLYSDITGPWDDNGYGFDMKAARRLATNSWRKGRVSPEQFLAEPQRWAAIDYYTLKDPNLRAELSWEVVRGGTAHGLCLWFDSTLAEGVSFSNSPASPELLYGNGFFPLASPVSLDAGDSVSVSLSANIVGDDYVWRWDTRVVAGGEVKADFKQSTFFALNLSPEQLRKRSAAYHPSLNSEGQVEHFILSLMDGRNSLQKIAVRVAEQFPGHFTDEHEALAAVSKLSLKYSR